MVLASHVITQYAFQKRIVFVCFRIVACIEGLVDNNSGGNWTWLWENAVVSCFKLHTPFFPFLAGMSGDSEGILGELSGSRITTICRNDWYIHTMLEAHCVFLLKSKHFYSFHTFRREFSLKLGTKCVCKSGNSFVANNLRYALMFVYVTFPISIFKQVWTSFNHCLFLKLMQTNLGLI